MRWLTHRLEFPPVKEADPGGALALGGDLSPERLLLAYRSGIFPWYNEGQPIVWYSPDPRVVLYPDRLRMARRTRSVLNQQRFKVTYDTQFSEVIRRCQQIKRPNQVGTWITEGMCAAYVRLHQLGHAHSVEVWQESQLVGGVYGIALGSLFFGESMFSLANNASKIGFITLVRRLQEHGFTLIDCQVAAPHLAQWGAEPIPRDHYLGELSAGLTRNVCW